MTDKKALRVLFCMGINQNLPINAYFEVTDSADLHGSWGNNINGLMCGTSF